MPLSRKISTDERVLSPTDSRTSSSDSQDCLQQHQYNIDKRNMEQRADRSHYKSSREDRSGRLQGHSAGSRRHSGGSRDEHGHNITSTSSKDNRHGPPNRISKDEPFEWTPYAELHFLNSLKGLRPVGANFHFCMMAVHNRFNTAMGIELPREELMKKLNIYYQLDEALKINGEDLPLHQSTFSLPKDIFQFSKH